MLKALTNRSASSAQIGLITLLLAGAPRVSGWRFAANASTRRFCPNQASARPAPKPRPAFHAWFGVMPEITPELRRAIEATL